MKTAIEIQAEKYADEMNDCWSNDYSGFIAGANWALDQFRPRPYSLDPKTFFEELTDEQRLSLVGMCCKGCGSLDTRCQCWNDD